jgi:hypothetical protein
MATAKRSREVMMPGREAAKSHRLETMLRIPEVVPEPPPPIKPLWYGTSLITWKTLKFTVKFS